METMEPSWFRFYGVMRKMLSFTGQWPYQRRRPKLVALSVMTVSAISIILPQMAKFVHCDGDRQCILRTVPSFFLSVIIMVKLCMCQFNSNKVRYLNDYLLSDWEKLRSPEEYEIMITYAANGRRLCVMCLLYCIVICSLFLLVSLVPHVLDIVSPLNESRPILMPYEAYYLVDEKEYFAYILTHNLIAWLIFVTGMVAHDCIVLTYTEHVCSIFAIAGFHFENLVHDHIDEMSPNLYNRKIAVFVHIHRRALQFADALEDTFTTTFAIQIVISTAWISITLLQVVMQFNDVVEAARYIGFIVAQLFHLFFFSLQGQKMIDHSLQIHDNTYNCLWYKIPVKSQRLLLNVMSRSVQPNFLSAGKIYIFSLRSFTTVVQTSLSYFTVLASFQ